ncbi:ATP-binding protein [Embleya sp. NPDC050154]|uniref:ATP-binding protein n=1 Tax=Embleya sp. NPDC050154 TaxID=3363988 RepID=UPI0037AE7E5C
MTIPPRNPPTEELSWTLTHSGGVLGRVRATVRDALGGWGRPPDRADDVVQVVSELVGNVLRHTHGEAELTLSPTPDGVEIAVGDHARDLLVLQRPANGDGGYGLCLLDMLTTTWSVEQHEAGKHVRARIRR